MINDAVKSLRAKNLRPSMSSTEKHSASAISHSRIAKNLASFANLHVLSGDGTDPEEAARLIGEAVAFVRAGQGPALADRPL